MRSLHLEEAVDLAAHQGGVEKNQQRQAQLWLWAAILILGRYKIPLLRQLFGVYHNVEGEVNGAASKSILKLRSWVGAATAAASRSQAFSGSNTRNSG